MPLGGSLETPHGWFCRAAVENRWHRSYTTTPFAASATHWLSLDFRHIAALQRRKTSQYRQIALSSRKARPEVDFDCSRRRQASRGKARFGKAFSYEF